MESEQRNPFPIHLLNEDQKVAYFEWRNLLEICHNPPPKNLEIGTIVMPTGYWMDRAPSSLENFKDRFTKQENSPHLVVTGKHSHPDLLRGGASATKVIRAFRIYGGLNKKMNDFLIAEGLAGNTSEQAENVYDLLIKNLVSEPIVAVVSAEHLPRFYSTFLATILKREHPLRTRLFSVAVFGDWESEIPKEKRGKRYEQISAEMGRFPGYRIKGDVATEEEVFGYSRWLRNQNHG